MLGILRRGNRKRGCQWVVKKAIEEKEKRKVRRDLKDKRKAEPRDNINRVLHRETILTVFCFSFISKHGIIKSIIPASRVETLGGEDILDAHG